MPIYDYLCTEGHRFERMQSFSDDALTVCEVCGKPVHRVLHAPAVHFKGKGFYSTDYGRGGKKGGKARAKALTPAKRRAIAKKAAKSRWHNN